MKKHIFKLLVFITSMLTASDTFSMEKDTEYLAESYTEHVSSTKSDNNEPEDNECPICFHVKSDNEFIILVCQHRFCVECIKQWFIYSDTYPCPYCEKPIEKKDINMPTKNFSNAKVIAGAAAICGISLYGFYRYFLKSRSSINQNQDIIKRSTSNKISNIKNRLKERIKKIIHLIV